MPDGRTRRPCSCGVAPTTRPGERHCTICHTWQPVTAYYVVAHQSRTPRSTPDGRRSHCKTCDIRTVRQQRGDTQTSAPALDVTAARTSLGLSTYRLSKLLGISHTTVARWESGDRPPPPFLALALAELGRQLQEQQP